MRMTKEKFRKTILKDQAEREERRKKHERDLNTYIHETQCKTRKLARKSKYASQNPN